MSLFYQGKVSHVPGAEPAFQGIGTVCRGDLRVEQIAKTLQYDSMQLFPGRFSGVGLFEIPACPGTNVLQVSGRKQPIGQ